ncbi:2Fe-2S iron-sulfur cluster binding domain-containing protein [Pseudomonas gessardii]|uniref:2Fe-2S iron-sulfur cluster binding domain-containing protein n=1 Tax=Pseudomonas gessardii TaxID=78544 RepID=A0ABS9F0G8_9PSED|nr:benzoate 1,2-dioxygenase electron transfer component BenC [Pseudomonas gessardii]MCF4981521.1 2Fe-2S iron-sulfur cluster binding domain-containing protein [Pseudomonas gessardii]MCF4992600.1 2Fe-2S iron-sulfur cluster binding domain-containing protein [Pseudomonas gessardii]MCF5086917.1 2Fe-2S iron-sulfur cluster binding domain-containing protein [Pseudomonas gessardii]MCF5096858.1 2Fe-2S iron-sulfur cluster binding domain-containing protein [Pseudomonas gessardii]MCF5105891.1 2Fe-2S iron-s
MTYAIALNFEDGVTRFIDCQVGEKVLDAAFRQRINLPMDCSDGVCGTCKCRCETGAYDLGDDYIEDALSADEAQERQVLTCQMVPHSDCVIAVPVPSSACKTGTTRFAATLASITRHADAALEVSFELDHAPVFLPGQYVNIDVPDSGQTRSYSFSSRPGEALASFLIKHVPGGLMSGWLERAQPGDSVLITGPLGSFYLREVVRPLLLLAGGTGLAPFLSMLEVLALRGETRPITLIYGVTRDQDLVLVEALEAFAARLPNLTLVTCVADPQTAHPRQGYVTQHMASEVLNDGDIDVYLCGPPPMVDAVRQHFKSQGVSPASFHYEKFTPNAVASADAA